MKRTLIPGNRRFWPLLFFFLCIGLFSVAQSRYAGSTVDLIVSGTSTLHDWNMKSVKADCSGVFSLNGAGQITAVEGLVFSTPATALKSEHTSMDNNAYKALKTDRNPVIVYTVTSVSVAAANGGATLVTCNGKLSIAGATRDEQIVALCKPNGDNTISVSGTEKISMKDFSIEAPTFMLGTIKTGNDITLSFALQLKRS
ncbi:MAG TPA: YceI family protein [Puia sp.]|nr:YceI family protein [Puia sp.]